LGSREGAVIAWEDGLIAIECALGRACMEHHAEHAQTEAVQHDYLTKSCTLTSYTKHSLDFNRMLEEHQILPSLQKRICKCERQNW
jgi:hypothetical protein